MIFGSKHRNDDVEQVPSISTTQREQAVATTKASDEITIAASSLNIHDQASNNNIVGLRAQILDNAIACYARSNFRVVTEVLPASVTHSINTMFCAMLVKQDIKEGAQDHIVTIKLKSKPCLDRESALLSLLAETEIGVDKLLGGLKVGMPQRFAYDPPS